MFSFPRLAVALVLSIGFAQPALADWIVSKVTQPARYAVDGRTWRQVTPGLEVPDNAWIHTGRRGRVILRQAGDTIQFKPNTVAAISDGSDGAGSATTVIQKFGAILLDIDPDGRGNSAVETPFLAAIVKGTRFTVEVRTDGATLRVAEGLVEVTDLIRGLRGAVRRGQFASVGAEGGPPLSILGPGERAAVVAVAPAAPRVRAARPAEPPAGRDASSFRGRDQEENGEAWRERLERALQRQEEDREMPAATPSHPPPEDPAGEGEAPPQADVGDTEDPAGEGEAPPPAGAGGTDGAPEDPADEPTPPQGRDADPVSGN